MHILGAAREDRREKKGRDKDTYHHAPHLALTAQSILSAHLELLVQALLIIGAARCGEHLGAVPQLAVLRHLVLVCLIWERYIDSNRGCDAPVVTGNHTGWPVGARG